jgi:hypothetical protein
VGELPELVENVFHQLGIVDLDQNLILVINVGALVNPTTSQIATKRLAPGPD